MITATMGGMTGRGFCSSRAPRKSAITRQKNRKKEVRIFVFGWYQMDHHAFLCICKMGNYNKKDVSFLLLKQRIASHFRKKLLFYVSKMYHLMKVIYEYKVVLISSIYFVCIVCQNLSPY